VPARARRRIAVCSALALGFGAFGVTPVVSAAPRGPSVPTAPGVPAAARPVVSPYLELSGANLPSLDAAVTAGLRSVTVAFVIGNGCTPVWDDGSPVASDADKAAVVAGAQARGAEVVVSFGGQGGIDLVDLVPERRFMCAQIPLRRIRWKIDRDGGIGGVEQATQEFGIDHGSLVPLAPGLNPRG